MPSYSDYHDEFIFATCLDEEETAKAVNEQVKKYGLKVEYVEGFDDLVWRIVPATQPNPEDAAKKMLEFLQTYDGSQAQMENFIRFGYEHKPDEE